jgi:transposase
MKLYGAIDLHSTNNVTVVINEQDQVVYQKRLPNDLSLVAQQLLTHHGRWTGEGLPSSSRQHRGNPAIQWAEVYRCHSAARWLAHLLRLGSYPRDAFTPSKSEWFVICCSSGGSSCIRGRQTFSVSRVSDECGN